MRNEHFREKLIRRVDADPVADPKDPVAPAAGVAAGAALPPVPAPPRKTETGGYLEGFKIYVQHQKHLFKTSVPDTICVHFSSTSEDVLQSFGLGPWVATNRATAAATSPTT